MVKALILTLLLLSGCQTVSGSFCDISKPIRLSDVVIDTMTDAEVNAILAHNERGQRLCSWEP